MADRHGRAISEVLGFVFVFVLIISMVGLVYASGISGLQHARDAERVTNAERAFDVLAHNIEDITHRNAPSRATEIKLADARIGVSEAVIIEVSGNVVGDPSENFTVEGTTRPIEFTAESNSSVVYENGAVIRQDGAASVIQRNPGIRISESGSAIPMIQTSASDADAVGGSTTVLVRTARSSTEVAVANSTERWDAWMNVTSPRTETWERYLSGFDATTCSVTGDTVSCAFETERLFVTQHHVTVTIEE